jgi:hypothetical protein
MRHVLLLGYCVLVFLSADAEHLGMPDAKNGPNADVRAVIVANEIAVWEAAKKKDMRQFMELVAEDAHMIFASGVMTRSDYVHSAAERVITDYQLSDVQVYEANPGSVITIYKATISGTFRGVRVEGVVAREASLWVNRSGKWVAVLNQETPIR